MKQLTFEQLRILLFIFFGGLILTLFTYNYFHHDRFEYLGKGRGSIDKMTGKIYSSDIFTIDKD